MRSENASVCQVQTSAIAPTRAPRAATIFLSIADVGRIAAPVYVAVGATGVVVISATGRELALDGEVVKELWMLVVVL